MYLLKAPIIDIVFIINDLQGEMGGDCTKLIETLLYKSQ